MALVTPLRAHDGRPQIAFAVSKRCGGAVQRNLIRRRLRAAADQIAAGIPVGAYLIRTEPEVAELSYVEVVHSLREAIGRAAKKSKELSHGV